MATQVKDIMNPELFHLRRHHSAEDALNGLLAFGISGAPVLDGDDRPIGMLSLRELADRRKGQTAGDLMSSPALVISAEATVAEAGRLLALTSHHRLVVVDTGGKALGNVSALDVLRAVFGLTPYHPDAFPHLESTTHQT
jgi:CBS domain-containing protein